jgi:hypothetical protein
MPAVRHHRAYGHAAKRSLRSATMIDGPAHARAELDAPGYAMHGEAAL